VAAAPVGVRKSKADAKPQNPLYEKRSKNFGESLPASLPNYVTLYSLEALLLTANSKALLKHKQALADSHCKALLSATTCHCYRHWWSSSPKEGSAQAGQVAQICAHSEAEACPWPAFEGSPCAHQVHQDSRQEHSSDSVQAVVEVPPRGQKGEEGALAEGG